MKINRSLSATLCRVSAVALFTVSSAAMLNAQQPKQVAELNQPELFHFTTSSSLDLKDSGDVLYSSSVGSDSPVSPDALTFSSSKTDDAAQPPPRRRYGRPNYSDRMHNADGSSKITVLVGGGFTNPTNTSTSYLNISWKVQTGIGYNFNKKAGVVFQFDWDNFGVPASVISNQYNVYNTYFNGGANLSGLDANTHDWSFTLNPTVSLYEGESKGVYGVIGAGFYHKVTQFTLPQTQTYFDPYYGYIQYSANATFDEYTSNSFGINGGLGMTFKPSRFANQKFYAEARYVYNFNAAKPFSTAKTNLYPGNSATTSYIPVTVGIRF